MARAYDGRGGANESEDLFIVLNIILNKKGLRNMEKMAIKTLIQACQKPTLNK